MMVVVAETRHWVNSEVLRPMSLSFVRMGHEGSEEKLEERKHPAL